MYIFVNLGSGTNLIPIRALGDSETLGFEYVIFNFDSGHQLLSNMLLRRDSGELERFVQRALPTDALDELSKVRKQNETRDEAQGKAYLINLLFNHVDFDAVFAMLDLLDSTMYLKAQKALSEETTAPNYERAFADQVLLPDGIVDVMLAMSPFGYSCINPSTVSQLKPGGEFIVIGTSSNKFFKTPAAPTTPEALGLVASEAPGALAGRLLAFVRTMPSFNTHGGELKHLAIKLFKKS